MSTRPRHESSRHLETGRTRAGHQVVPDSRRRETSGGFLFESSSENLPLLPAAAMPGRAAAGARCRAELRAGLARVGGLEDFASGVLARVVGRGLARRRAAWAIGQGFGAVHFVEVGFVDAGGGVSTTRGPPPRPRGRASLASDPARGRGKRHRRHGLAPRFQCTGMMPD